MTYDDKLRAYREFSERYFESDRYWAWCSEHLAHLPAAVLEWVDSEPFDDLLVETVKATYQVHEHEQFVAHFRGLVGLWTDDQWSLLTAP